jgi:hypothetical protein
MNDDSTAGGWGLGYARASALGCLTIAAMEFVPGSYCSYHGELVAYIWAHSVGSSKLSPVNSSLFGGWWDCGSGGFGPRFRTYKKN